MGSSWYVIIKSMFKWNQCNWLFDYNVHQLKFMFSVNQFSDYFKFEWWTWYPQVILKLGGAIRTEIAFVCFSEIKQSYILYCVFAITNVLFVNYIFIVYEQKWMFTNFTNKNGMGVLTPLGALTDTVLLYYICTPLLPFGCLNEDSQIKPQDKESHILTLLNVKLVWSICLHCYAFSSSGLTFLFKSHMPVWECSLCWEMFGQCPIAQNLFSHCGIW